MGGESKAAGEETAGKRDTLGANLEKNEAKIHCKLVNFFVTQFIIIFYRCSKNHKLRNVELRS